MTPSKKISITLNGNNVGFQFFKNGAIQLIENASKEDISDYVAMYDTFTLLINKIRILQLGKGDE